MVEIIVGGIVVVAAAIYLKIQKKNKEIEDYKKVIKQYINNYQFEECDKPMIESCRLYISSRFSGRIEEHFARCNNESEKEQLLYSVAQELITRMGVKVDGVKFVDLGSHTYGKAEVDKATGKVVVSLNKEFISANPKQMIKTLCHELRHCVQYKSITDNVWEYSDQRVALWMANYEDYLNPDECTFLAYQLQPVELDANAFAEAIIPN